MKPSQGDFPLKGVRILDLATVVAAPFSATLCGDMGAEVVKIELPQGGDPLRTLAPVDGDHALFWKVGNRGKKGITLDVRKTEGRQLFLKLIRDFDVLVENFRTGTLDGWGLDMPTLLQHNPQLIVLRLTGFGQTGPYAQRPGFARIFEAMSGLTYITGEPDRPPQHTNYPLGDAIAGLFGAFAIATALAQRNALPEAQRRGAEIDLSATEALFRLLDPLAAEWQFKGKARERAGSRATYTAPSNVFQTEDGHWITVVGTGNPIFERLCKAMDRPDLLTDPRFANNVLRTQNLIALDDILAAWCRSCPLRVIQEKFDAVEMPYSQVNSTADAATDPHFQHRQAIIHLPDRDLGTVPAPCIVPRFVGCEREVPSTGPATGQHNEEVYGALGLSLADQARLRSQGVI